MIDPAATAVEAIHKKELHREQTRVYHECKNVEKALLCHIQNALEEKFIEHMVDKDTGLIEHDIPTVLECLFLNYGKVPSEEVTEKEVEVLNITFNLVDSIVLLYHLIEQVQKLATCAGILYSLAQQL